MATNKAGWFLTIGGAAAGLALAGGLLRRKRQRESEATEDEDSGRASGLHQVVSTDEFDHRDVNSEVASALRASEHVHGVQHAASDEFAQELTTRAVDRADAHQERLELDELLGTHPLAADEHVLARDLIDDDNATFELPIGRSAEPEIEAILDHGSNRQPDTTGVLLADDSISTGRETGEWHNTSAPEFDVSAQPKPAMTAVSDAEATTAAADELGSDFLERATQSAAALETSDDSELQELELVDLFREAGVGVMSEASSTASDPEELERAADAHLARTRGEALPDEDEDTLADADAEEQTRK